VQYPPPGYPPTSYAQPGYGDQRPPSSGTPPLDFGEVIDRGFRLWWKTIKSVAPWAILFAIPAQVLAVLLARRGGGLQPWLETWQQTVKDNPGEPPNFNGLGQAFRMEVPGFLAAFVTTTIIRGVLTAYYTDRILVRETPIISCLKSVIPRIVALIGVVVFVGIAGIAGLLACLVGSIFVTTRLAVAAQACVVERAGAAQAVKRSWSLTERRFWPMFGLVLVSGLISGIVRLPFTVIGDAIGTATKSIPGAVAQIAFTTIGTGLGGALGASIFVFAYLDLRVRFEQLDLGAIAAQNATPAS
jgi:hypothetical protein